MHNQARNVHARGAMGPGNTSRDDACGRVRRRQAAVMRLAALGHSCVGQQGKRRIVTQIIVVVDIYVAERDGVHALRDQRFEAVHDVVLVTPVAATARNAFAETGDTICFDAIAPLSKAPTTWTMAAGPVSSARW